MYSPKIDEKHVSELYKIAEVLNVPMTSLVESIIGDWLKRAKENGVEKLFTETKENGNS